MVEPRIFVTTQGSQAPAQKALEGFLQMQEVINNCEVGKSGRHLPQRLRADCRPRVTSAHFREKGTRWSPRSPALLPVKTGSSQRRGCTSLVTSSAWKPAWLRGNQGPAGAPEPGQQDSDVPPTPPVFSPQDGQEPRPAGSTRGSQGPLNSPWASAQRRTLRPSEQTAEGPAGRAPATSPARAQHQGELASAGALNWNQEPLMSGTVRRLRTCKSKDFSQTCWQGCGIPGRSEL